MTMALTTCSECKGKVSDQAWMCPHCGFAMGQALEDFLHQQKTATARAAAASAPDAVPGGEEKRRHKRIDHKTMIRVNGETAMLFNISKSGMMLSAPFKPKTPSVDVTLDNGEKVFSMKGAIRWISGKRSFSNLIDFGVEISEAPPEYYDFVEILLASQ
jgi:RNA polymerase subunit RPABC4/transcription elongation factor Spt4